MNKVLMFKLEEAANYFYKEDRSENEDYLLHLILELGKEYNKIVEEFNELSRMNEILKIKLQLQSKVNTFDALSKVYKNRK